MFFLYLSGINNQLCQNLKIMEVKKKEHDKKSRHVEPEGRGCKKLRRLHALNFFAPPPRVLPVVANFLG